MAPPPGSPPAEAGSGRTIALVAAAVVAIGLLALLILRREPAPPPSPSPSPREPSPPAGAPPARPRASSGAPPITYERYGLPVPTDPTDLDSPCGAACACTSTNDPCKAGKLCTSQGCDAPLEGKTWRLRFGGLETAVAPPGGLDGDTRVCVGRSGARDSVCTTLKQLHASDCARGTGLSVTTEQLTGEGLDIEVRDPKGKVVARADKAAYASLTQRDICVGVRFGGGKFKGPLAVDKVSFWLDELS